MLSRDAIQLHLVFQELGGGLRADDILMSLRSGPSAPVQKSQDVLAGL